MEAKSKYKFVNYLWDDKKAKLLGDDQVSLFLYRSNILGEDLRITNYGGGNTRSEEHTSELQSHS